MFVCCTRLHATGGEAGGTLNKKKLTDPVCMSSPVSPLQRLLRTARRFVVPGLLHLCLLHHAAKEPAITAPTGLDHVLFCVEGVTQRQLPPEGGNWSSILHACQAANRHVVSSSKVLVDPCRLQENSTHKSTESHNLAGTKCSVPSPSLSRASSWWIVASRSTCQCFTSFCGSVWRETVATIEQLTLWLAHKHTAQQNPLTTQFPAMCTKLVARMLPSPRSWRHSSRLLGLILSSIQIIARSVAMLTCRVNSFTSSSINQPPELL